MSVKVKVETMRKVIYICDNCGKEYENEELENIITIRTSRADSHIDVFTDDIHVNIMCGEDPLHFCSPTCIAGFIETVIDNKRQEGSEYHSAP